MNDLPAGFQVEQLGSDLPQGFQVEQLGQANPYNDEGATWAEEPQAVDPWLPTPQRNTAFAQQAQQPKPPMSLTDRAIDVYTRAANDPGGAFFGAIGKVGEKVGLLDEGEQRGERFGRALVNSLGPLGVEFAPLGSVPKTQAARPLPAQPMPSASVRTSDELASTGGGRMGSAKQSEATVSVEDMQGALASFDAKMKAASLRPHERLHPTASAVQEEILAKAGSPQTLEELHYLRQLADDAAAKPGAEGKIGRMQRDAVDEMIARHPEGARFKQGSNEYARSMQSRVIEEALEKAERSAQWQRGDHAGAIRNAVRPLLDKKKYKWSPEVRKALERAHRMTTTEIVGGLGATTPGRFLLGRMLETMVGLPMVGFGPGLIARQAANAAKTEAMKKAAELVRAGGPVAEGRLSKLGELFSPKVLEHVAAKAEGAKRIAAWAMNPSPQTARALATFTAQSVKQPDLAARILAELQGTEQGQAQE